MSVQIWSSRWSRSWSTTAPFWYTDTITVHSSPTRQKWQAQTSTPWITTGSPQRSHRNKKDTRTTAAGRGWAPPGFQINVKIRKEEERFVYETVGKKTGADRDRIDRHQFFDLSFDLFGPRWSGAHHVCVVGYRAQRGSDAADQRRDGAGPSIFGTVRGLADQLSARRFWHFLFSEKTSAGSLRFQVVAHDEAGAVFHDLNAGGLHPLRDAGGRE